MNHPSFSVNQYYIVNFQKLKDIKEPFKFSLISDLFERLYVLIQIIFNYFFMPQLSIPNKLISNSSGLKIGFLPALR